MFGTNPISKLVPKPTNEGTPTLNIQEIFYTIQGEGPFSGSPAVFIRFAGCNLHCKMCDTEFSSGTTYTIQQVCTRVREVAENAKGPKPLIVITGGEPLLQYGIVPLIRELSRDRIVQIETAGTVWQPELENVDPFPVIVCSPKTPKLHPYIHQWIHSYKYVVQAGRVDENDGLPTYTYQEPIRKAMIARPWDYRLLFSKVHPLLHDWRNSIYISPCDQYNALNTKRNTQVAHEICMKYGYKLSLQIHKIIGLP